MRASHLLIFLFVCITASKVNAGDTAEYNKNFHSRFEYVISVLEHITDYDEDIPLGLTLVVDEKNSRPIYIGIKNLYYTLYGKMFETKEQLYFSVGKMFLHDTLNITRASLDLFKNYLVDTAELGRLNTTKFDKNLLECCGNMSQKIRRSYKESQALRYYFDRRFYPTLPIHNEGDATDFKYSFTESNLIQFLRGKKMYNQIYDRNGVLISEQEAQN